jgi:hypothetical protein
MFFDIVRFVLSDSLAASFKEDTLNVTSTHHNIRNDTTVKQTKLNIENSLANVHATSISNPRAARPTGLQKHAPETNRESRPKAFAAPSSPLHSSQMQRLYSNISFDLP